MVEKPGYRSGEAIKVAVAGAAFRLSALTSAALKTADEVCKRGVNLPIQPDQPIWTMAIVVPARMIENWVKTDTFDRNTAPPRLVHLITDIGEPRSPIVALDPGFCDK